MNCCIGIGQLIKNLYFLLLASIFRLLNKFIYGIKEFENIGKRFYIYKSIINDNIILQSIMKFFGITALSFLYCKYENQQIDHTILNSNNYNLQNWEKSDSYESKNEKSKFPLIYNEVEIDNTKFTAQILFIGFLLAFVELADQFYFLAAPSNTDYWTFEILFASFFIRKIFKTKLYAHQIFSLFFVIF